MQHRSRKHVQESVASLLQKSFGLLSDAFVDGRCCHIVFMWNWHRSSWFLGDSVDNRALWVHKSSSSPALKKIMLFFGKFFLLQLDQPAKGQTICKSIYLQLRIVRLFFPFVWIKQSWCSVAPVCVWSSKQTFGISLVTQCLAEEEVLSKCSDCTFYVVVIISVTSSVVESFVPHFHRRFSLFSSDTLAHFLTWKVLSGTSIEVR